jgi:ribosomal protein L40E
MASKPIEQVVMKRYFNGVFICQKCNASNKIGKQNIDGYKCRKCKAKTLRKRKKRKA